MADERTSFFSKGSPQVPKKYGAATSTGKSTRFATHTIQPTDTLAGIALRYSVPPALILRANKLSSENAMFAMKTLMVPLPSGEASTGSATVDGSGSTGHTTSSCGDGKKAKSKSKDTKGSLSNTKPGASPPPLQRPASTVDFLSQFDARFSATKSSVEQAAKSSVYRSPTTTTRRFDAPRVEVKDNEAVLADTSLHAL